MFKNCNYCGSPLPKETSVCNRCFVVDPFKKAEKTNSLGFRSVYWSVIICAYLLVSYELGIHNYFMALFR
ncbi:hypothetical protein ACU5EH_25705 [Aliivibrio salmonicida]|uniref:hypothetical protein n=1 Tax=Aliivibrio salmonicida TaxID=40269 RepID=UPI00406BF3BD